MKASEYLDAIAHWYLLNIPLFFVFFLVGGRVPKWDATFLFWVCVQAATWPAWFALWVWFHV